MAFSKVFLISVGILIFLIPVKSVSIPHEGRSLENNGNETRIEARSLWSLFSKISGTPEPSVAPETQGPTEESITKTTNSTNDLGALGQYLQKYNITPAYFYEGLQIANQVFETYEIARDKQVPRKTEGYEAFDAPQYNMTLIPHDFGYWPALRSQQTNVDDGFPSLDEMEGVEITRNGSDITSISHSSWHEFPTLASAHYALYEILKAVDFDTVMEPVFGKGAKVFYFMEKMFEKFAESEGKAVEEITEDLPRYFYNYTAEVIDNTLRGSTCLELILCHLEPVRKLLIHSNTYEELILWGVNWLKVLPGTLDRLTEAAYFVSRVGAEEEDDCSRMFSCEDFVFFGADFFWPSVMHMFGAETNDTMH